VHTRAAWFIAVLTACLAWVGPAGAAQVSGALAVTGTTATTVSFTATAQRTCEASEQCDYYADLLEIDGASSCPATFPGDEKNVWNGEVLNTGPSTESGTISPAPWLSGKGSATSQLCLFVFADGTYYYVGGTTITRPGPPPAAGSDTPGAPTTTPGSTTTTPKTPGSSGSSGGSGGSGGSAPGKDTCAGYTYQQDAQKALGADPSLAARLDPDHNGVACQSLPKRQTYVKTLGKVASATSARAALRHTYGKSFTRGTKYRARCVRQSRVRVRCTVTWQNKGAWRGYVDVVGAIRKNKQTVVTHIHVRRP
jgi:hypothetical protein